MTNILNVDEFSSLKHEFTKDDLSKLNRDKSDALKSLLSSVETYSLLDSTKTMTHTHFLQKDSQSGEVKVDGLIDFIMRSLVTHAMPRSKIKEAGKDSFEHIKLLDEAKALYTHIKNSGEGGEVLLFALTESILKLPQVIAKMPLKTNTGVHVHGIDALHVGFDENKKVLELYWGESKMHSNANQAIREAISSIAPYFNPKTVKEKTKNDIRLLTGYADLGDDEKNILIRMYLNPDKPEFSLVKHKGICFIGCDSDAYEDYPNISDIEDLHKKIEENVKKELVKWKAKLTSNISDNSLSEIDMHVMFLPFPSVASFRKKFLERLEPYAK